MMQIALPAALALFIAALVLSVWRLAIGPAISDRILALDTVYINALAILVLVGIWRDTMIYFEAALVIAMLGFVGTVTLCKYVLGGDIVE